MFRGSAQNPYSAGESSVDVASSLSQVPVGKAALRDSDPLLITRQSAKQQYELETATPSKENTRETELRPAFQAKQAARRSLRIQTKRQSATAMAAKRQQRQLKLAQRAKHLPEETVAEAAANQTTRGFANNPTSLTNSANGLSEQLDTHHNLLQNNNDNKVQAQIQPSQPNSSTAPSSLRADDSAEKSKPSTKPRVSKPEPKKPEKPERALLKEPNSGSMASDLIAKFLNKYIFQPIDDWRHNKPAEARYEEELKAYQLKYAAWEREQNGDVEEEVSTAQQQTVVMAQLVQQESAEVENQSTSANVTTDNSEVLSAAEAANDQFNADPSMLSLRAQLKNVENAQLAKASAAAVDEDAAAADRRPATSLVRA